MQAWLAAAAVTAGPMFRAINKAGRVATHGFSPNVIWSVVTTACSQCGLPGVTPHDLRRTCARLCHYVGSEIEQVQYLLGHESVQTN
jgi:integrase